MNLSRVNLNLLVALDVLLTERHVTRAGKKLHISQSAMSAVLKQLRETFHDPLFVRGARSQMIPTPRALELALPVKEALEKASLVFARPDVFNPKKSERTFVIGMSDYTEFVLLPSLVRHITQIAPCINLVIKHVNFLSAQQVMEFQDDQLDLAVGIYRDIPERLNSQVLFSDRALCVGAHGHPLLKKPITLEEFAKADQLVVLFYEDQNHLLTEQILQSLGFMRRAVVTMPHILPALFLLPQTHLISFVLERIVQPFKTYLNLCTQLAPIENPTVNILQVWHPKTEQDAALMWLREQVLRVGVGL